MNESSTLVEHLIERWFELRQLGRSVEVEELCRDHPEHVGTVRQRIAAINSIDAFAKNKTVDFASREIKLETPEFIDGYQILEVLGRGGMGVVYKARQSGLGRIVALKFLLAGAHAAAKDRERFRHEAEVLAKLHHPGIVQIHEIGETPQGTYLVLEYLDGGSLAEHLDGKPWPVAPAVHLVEQIADAVEAAHRAGIVHRDLKPGNILLSTEQESWSPVRPVEKHERSTEVNAPGNPTPPISPLLRPTSNGPLPLSPKITDFGIAKRLYSDTGLTGTGAIVGTPAYMSPEQAGGQSRDTGPASDVYSLGAILYELLTGRPPFNGATPIETIMQVRTIEPIPPSRLNPQVPRDLETVCLKCLEKDPPKRYPSAAFLANDLRRLLTSERILARPPGWLSIVVKWIRRNPSRAALVGTLLVALMASVAGGIWHTLRVRAERDRAERNVELAMQAVDEMLTEVAQDHLALEPRMEEKRRVLLEKALAFYEKLQAENANNPKLRRQGTLGQKRLADILRLLGRFGEAEVAYRRAIEQLGPLAKSFPDDWEVQRALADSHNYLGETLRLSGQLPEARVQYQAAKQLQESSAQRFADATLRMDLARTRYNLGLLSRESGELETACGELRAAILQLRALTEEDSGQIDCQQHLARALFNLGTVLRQQGDLKGAIEVTQEAIDRLESLRKQHPEQPDYQHELAVARNNLGNYSARDKRPVEAETQHHAAADLFRTLARDFPRTPIYRRELANSLNSLGATLAGQRKLDDARPVWDESAQLLDQLVAGGMADPGTRGVLGATRGNLGKLYLLKKDYAAARRELELGLPHLEAALKLNLDQPDYLQSFRNQVRDLAETLIRSNALTEAVNRVRNLEDAFARPPMGRRFALLFLARCLHQAEMGMPETAIAPLRKEALRLLSGMNAMEIGECRKDPDLAAFLDRAEIKKNQPP